MSEQEEWLPIAGFPDYRVSSLGQVVSIKRGEFRVLTGGKTEMGYRNVLLYACGIRKTFRVHALVAAAFHGPRPEGLEIRHLDGNQLNNAASNLRYGTHAENVEDRRRHRGLLLIVGEDPVPASLEDRERRRRNVRPKTDCRNGHPFTEANTYRYPDGRPTCRTCKKSTEQASRTRRAARATGVEVSA